MRIEATSAPVAISPGNTKDSIQVQAENRQIVRAVRAVNAAGQLGQNELTFSLDRDSRRMIVKIVDRQTNEVVEQIPSENVLRLAENLSKPAEFIGMSAR